MWLRTGLAIKQALVLGQSLRKTKEKYRSSFVHFPDVGGVHAGDPLGLQLQVAVSPNLDYGQETCVLCKSRPLSLSFSLDD